jgi:hypothetical protein
VQIALLCTALIVGTAGCAVADESVARTFQLPNLSMRQDQLADVIESINNFIAHANEHFSDCKSSSVRVTISDNSTSVEFDGAQIRDELHHFPEVFFRSEVRYYCSSHHSVPISHVTLNLGDGSYDRRLVVEGARSDQVEALASMVVSKLELHSKLLTGMRFRTEVGSLFFSILLTATLFVTFLHWRGIRFVGSSWLSFPLTVCAFVLMGYLSDWLFPFLPGFAAYAGDVSFIRRYAAEFGFLALLISVGGLIAGLIRRFSGKLAASGRLPPDDKTLG